jgi:hypothetical protein
MTELTATEMLERIKRGLTENSARFWPKIIVYEGMNGWGALRGQLFAALQRLGWRADGEDWYPPEGQSLDAAYAELCAAVPPAPGMARDNLQPLLEGGYPESEVWFEQFGSYPQLRIEGDALVFYAAPITVAEHLGFLYRRHREFRESGAFLVAMDLKERAEEIDTENPLPIPPTEEQVASILRRRQQRA